MKHCFFFLVQIWLSGLVVQAQKQQAIGVNISSEIYPTPRLKLVPGISYELQITKKSGGEAGLLYRPANVADMVLPDGKVVTVARRYLTAYLTYRFYVNSFIISGGPSFSRLASWKQLEGDGVQLNEYKEEPEVKTGFLLRLSRKFNLKTSLFIEPELRFTNFSNINFRGIIDKGASNFSIGVSLKYRCN
ncbi:MAG TPA: hypothetical protein PKC69_04225 [Chitinophagaceae bacterium]|nr:hypothetical protein [Chitinophagaceae bacterium]